MLTGGFNRLDIDGRLILATGSYIIPKVIGPYASVAYKASPETGWGILELYAQWLKVSNVPLHDGSTLNYDDDTSCWNSNKDPGDANK